MDAEAHSACTGRMRAERALEGTDHLIDGPGRRLRDRALGEVRPRRFESATTSPVPLAPSHVPPACRSRGATMIGVPSRTAGGSAGRIEDSSRFIPRTMSYLGTERQNAMRVHTAAPHFICLRSYARICATRATSGRPAFAAGSIARSYARMVASRRLASPLVVACSLIASAVSKKYFAAVRWSPSVPKNPPAKRPSWVRPSAPPEKLSFRTAAYSFATSGRDASPWRSCTAFRYSTRARYCRSSRAISSSLRARYPCPAFRRHLPPSFNRPSFSLHRARAWWIPTRSRAEPEVVSFS